MLEPELRRHCSVPGTVVMGAEKDSPAFMKLSSEEGRQTSNYFFFFFSRYVKLDFKKLPP